MDALRRNITRRHLLALGALAAASIVSACGGSASPTATTAPLASAAMATSAPASMATTAPAATTGTTSMAAAMAKPMVKGKIQVMRGTGSDDVWNARVTDFKAKTGVTVEMVVTTGNVDDGTIPTALKSGSGPDTVNVNSGPSRVGFLAQAGLIKPLDDAYKTYGWEQKMVPAVVDRLRNQGKIYQGKIWEFPATVDVIYWDYHKDVYAKAGIKPPTTLDEMNANFEKLKGMGLYPINLAARTNTPVGWLFGNLAQAAAGRDGVADVLFAEGRWDQPAFMQAAQLMADWSKKQYIAPSVTALTDLESIPVFANKQSTTYCVGTWAITTLSDAMADLGNIDTFFMPKITPVGSLMPTGGFGNSWVVAADSKNPDAAYAWIDYLFSDDLIKQGFDNPKSGSIPTVKIPAGVVPKTELLKKAVDTLGTAGTGYNPSVHLPPTVATVYFENLQGLAQGLVQPDKALAAIQAAKEKAK